MSLPMLEKKCECGNIFRTWDKNTVTCAECVLKRIREKSQ